MFANIHNFFLGGKTPEIKNADEDKKLLDKPLEIASDEKIGIDAQGRKYSEQAEKSPVERGFFDEIYERGAKAFEDFRAKPNLEVKAGEPKNDGLGDRIIQGLHGIVKWAVFSPDSQEPYRETIKRISGNEHLSQLIDAFVPTVVKSALEDKNLDNTWLKSALDGEEKFVENLAATVLLKVAANTSLKIEKRALDADPERKPVLIPNLTLAVLSEIAGVFKKHFNEIDQKYQAIASIENEEERKIALNSLFTPLANELLEIAFPNGPADLKINAFIQNTVFNYIRDTLIEQSQNIYLSALKPSHHTAADLEILKQKGGEGLKELSKIAAAKGIEAAKWACEEKKENIISLLDSYLSGSEVNIVKAHLAKELEFIATSNDPNLEWIWSLLKNNLESFSIHILSQLAATSPYINETNVTTKALKNLIDISVSFFAEKGVTFEQELARIAKLPQDERLVEKKRVFQPFIEQLLQKTGLKNDPLIAKVKDDKMVDLIEQLYIIGSSLFPSQAAEKQKLENNLSRNVPFTADAVLIDLKDAFIPGGALNPQDISNLLQAEKNANNLEEGCGFLAEDIKKIVIDYLNDNKGDVAEMMTLFLGQEGITKGGQDLAEAITSLMTAQDTNIKKAFDFAGDVFKTSIFKILSTLSNPENKERALADGLHLVITLLNHQIPAIDAHVQTIMASNMTQNEKTKAIEALFVPLAKEVLEMGGVNPDGSYKLQNILPIGDALKPFVMDKIQTVLLPKLFKSIYLDLTSAQRQMKSNEADVTKMIEFAPLGVKKIADYINKYVPYYLKNNADRVASLIMDKGGKYFNIKDAGAAADFKSLLAKNIKHAGTDAKLNPAWDGIAAFAQGFATKIMLQAAKNLEQAENHGKTANTNPLLINLLMGVMSTGEGHFKRISNLENIKGVKQASQLTDEDLFSDFRKAGALHPALMRDSDPNATQEEKDQRRLDYFFRPLAKELIVIAGMDNFDEYPLPSGLKESGKQILEDEIIPRVLMGVYQEILKPRNINKMMINLIDSLGTAAENLTDLQAEVEGEEVLDEKQKELNLQIGTLIKSFFDMMPDSVSKTLFSIRSINQMSAEKIGALVRKQTNATTLLDVVSALCKGVEIEAPDALENKTPDEIEAENKVIANELQSKMTTFISNQAKKTARNYIIDSWNSFQDNFDSAVEKYLGKPGLAVKKFLDFIFGGIMRIILPILDFIVFGALWGLLELHIWNKAGEGIQNAKMPIHENLAFQATEKVVKNIRNQLDEARIAQDEKKALAHERQRQQEIEAETIRNNVRRAQMAV